MKSQLFSEPANEPNNANETSSLYPANYDSLHRAEYRYTTTRQLVLSQDDYERFRVSVLERIGLDYPEEKRTMLERGLAQVMDLVGCDNLDELFRRLSAVPTTAVIWDQVISVLTIGETYFFRNTSHFDALTKHILPTLFAERQHGARRIRIWSAGCATGEEPYSIAIALKESGIDLSQWNILILGTDINREALKKAHEGKYGAWSFRGVDKRIQDKYFQLEGNQYILSSDIRRMVEFRYLNLVTDLYPSLTNNTNAMDIVMCRNVTIYFNEAVTRQVVQKFHACLVDGGWLIPGPSEPNLLYYNAFQACNLPGTVIYQKPVPRQPAAVFTPAIAVPLASAGSVTPAPKLTPVVKPAAPDLYRQAVACFKAEQIDEALEKLREKITRDPNFAPAYVLLGKIYASQGNLEEAQHWCERAIRIDKLHPEPYYVLSLIYQQYGLLDQAVDVLKKTIYLDRQFVLAHYNLAQIYLRQNDCAAGRKALQNVQKLLESKPRDELVPEGDGLTVGRLSELVANQLAEDSAP